MKIQAAALLFTLTFCMLASQPALAQSGVSPGNPGSGGLPPSIPAPMQIDPRPPTFCGVQRVKIFMARTATQAVKKAVAERSGAKTIRWLRIGMMVTQDYSPTRLNVRLGAHGQILGFSCG